MKMHHLLEIEGRVSAGAVSHRAEGDAHCLVNECGYAHLYLRGAPNSEKRKSVTSSKVIATPVFESYRHIETATHPGIQRK